MIQSFIGYPGPALGGSGLGGGDSIDEVIAAIEKLPAKEAEVYAKELERCLTLIGTGGTAGILTGYACIKALYPKVRAAVKAYEAGEEPAAEPPPKPPPPPPRGWSPALLPVLAVVSAAGVGAYFAFKD